MTGADLLALLMPPIELMEKLEQAPNLPEPIKVWHKRIKNIRSDGPSEIDGVSDEVYQQALFIVEEKAKVY